VFHSTIQPSSNLRVVMVVQTPQKGTNHVVVRLPYNDYWSHGLALFCFPQWDLIFSVNYVISNEIMHINIYWKANTHLIWIIRNSIAWIYAWTLIKPCSLLTRYFSFAFQPSLNFCNRYRLLPSAHDDDHENMKTSINDNASCCIRSDCEIAHDIPQFLHQNSNPTPEGCCHMISRQQMQFITGRYCKIL